MTRNICNVQQQEKGIVYKDEQSLRVSFTPGFGYTSKLWDSILNSHSNVCQARWAGQTSSIYFKKLCWSVTHSQYVCVLAIKPISHRCHQRGTQLCMRAGRCYFKVQMAGHPPGSRAVSILWKEGTDLDLDLELLLTLWSFHTLVERTSNEG